MRGKQVGPVRGRERDRGRQRKKGRFGEEIMWRQSEDARVRLRERGGERETERETETESKIGEK